MFTRFMDMHSGGGTKEPPYEYIYIEAPEAEAKVIFYNRFGHNPERVTCTCCGEDYSIDSYETLEDATAYDCRPPWGAVDCRAVSLEDYLARKDVLVIRASEITDADREGSVPAQGYVWVG
jgi:hypothetical protein